MENKSNFVFNYADRLFATTCIDILNNGHNDKHLKVRRRWADTNEPAHTKKKFGVVNRYDLSKEFPILTLREVPFKKCIDEILWIYQKKSNNIKDLNSKVWNQWADENGSIGKAYGYQLGIKHKYKEGMFDQVDRLLDQLKNNIADSGMIINMYNHSDLHEMNLRPCAYSTNFSVTGNKLNMILNQRSQDMLVANAWNVTQYATLLHMFAHVSGLEVGEFVHVIADAHIYDRHEAIVRDMCSTYAACTTYERKVVTLKINPDITDFYDFTVDDFMLDNYSYYTKITNIPVAE